MRRVACVFTTSVALVVVPVGASVVAQPGAPTKSSDTLPIRFGAVGNRLDLRIGGLAAIEVAPTFTYLGGSRFILGGTADAEQHLFVVADSSKAVTRLFWIQIESRLPTRPGNYDYSADSMVTIQGFPLAANRRTYTTPPDPTSDRARAFALVEARGLRVPEGATRVRLVYLPERPARREVMIVYLEAARSAGQESLLSRAARGVVLHRRP